MADHISDLGLFAQVAAAGSLTRAAHNLNSSPPAVSRRLAAMESRLGVRLIERTARRFRLTEEGGLLLERAQQILAQIEEAETEASSRSGQLKGRLRIGALLQLGRQQIAPLVARFAQQHAQLQLELVLSDATMDLVDDDLDLLLQIDVPAAPNTVARKLVQSRRVFCAAPAYLDASGRPQRPDDLLAHDCLCVVRGRRVLKRWKVRDASGPREIQVMPRLSSSSGEVVHNWVLAGHGIGLKLLWDVADDLAAGRLEECLPDFNDETVDLYAVYAQRRYQPPKIRAFLEMLSDYFAGQAGQAATV